MQKSLRTSRKGCWIPFGWLWNVRNRSSNILLHKKIAELGKKFGKKSFGVVVRASESAGVQSTERILKYDKSF